MWKYVAVWLCLAFALCRRDVDRRRHGIVRGVWAVLAMPW